MGQVSCINTLDRGRKGGKAPTGCSVSNENTPVTYLHKPRTSVCLNPFVATLALPPVMPA
jgi:hypothetical protein